MILSPDRPDLSIGVRRYGFPDDENAYQTKDYTPLLERVKMIPGGILNWWQILQEVWQARLENGEK